MFSLIDVVLTVEGGESIPLHVDAGPSISLELAEPFIGGRLPDYHGSVDVTPAGTAQTLATAGTSLLTDIVVEPIPSNYGRIAWNGAALTVS